MSENTPFFSVIIPTRNRAVLLKRCIESVIAQVCQNWELIIVDDGSDDDTGDVVKAFEDARIQYIYQEHQERSNARNRGIDEAMGCYVCFIDDDDYVLENYLSDFYDYYKEQGFPDVILRTGFLKVVNGKRIKTINYSTRKHKNPVKYVVYNMCGVWSLSIPRAFLEEHRFPPEFPHWQDTHLIIRLLMRHDFYQLENYNYVYFVHEEMGSIRAVIDYDPVERAELNVGAIKDLFALENEKIYDFVPANALNFLAAEKYIQYYNNILVRSKLLKIELLKKSLSSGVFTKIWKSYAMAIILTFKKKLGLG